MFELRPYQKNLTDKTIDCLAEDDVKKVCVTLATGGGKTIIARDLIEFYVNCGLRILFSVNRTELINQSKDKFGDMVDKVSVIKAGKEYESLFNAFLPVQVTMLQTWFARRKKISSLNPDLIIIDEVHDGWQAQRMTALLKVYPEAKVLGLTATPIDEKGYLLSGFDKYIQDLQTADLQKLGFLADDKVLAPVSIDLAGVRTTAGDYNEADLEEAVNKDFIVQNVLDHYKKYAHDRKTIAFCVNIKHAERTAAKFKEAGYRTAVIHSKMANPELRQFYLDELRKGNIDILFNVGVLTTGFDDPTVNCILFLRPTKVERLYIQMAGRGLRPYPGKENCLFLDCANLVKRFGVPSEYRIFDTKEEKDRKEKEKNTKLLCPECDCLNTLTAKYCSDCGYEFPQKTQTKECPACGTHNSTNSGSCKTCGYVFESQRSIDTMIVDLKEYKRRVYSREKILEEIKKYVVLFGYKEGFAKHLLKDIDLLKPKEWAEELFYKKVFSTFKECRRKRYKPFWMTYRLKEFFGQFQSKKIDPESLDDIVLEVFGQKV